MVPDLYLTTVNILTHLISHYQLHLSSNKASDSVPRPWHKYVTFCSPGTRYVWGPGSVSYHLISKTCTVNCLGTVPPEGTVSKRFRKYLIFTFL
jgi:hypothetical protein